MYIDVLNYNKYIDIDHEFIIKFTNIGINEILILINNDIVYSYGNINNNYIINIENDNDNLIFSIKKNNNFEYLERIKLIIDVKYKLYKTYDYITKDNNSPLIYELNINDNDILELKPYITFTLYESPEEVGVDINTLNVYITNDSLIKFYIENGIYDKNEVSIIKNNTSYIVKIYPIEPLEISQKYYLNIEVKDNNNNLSRKIIQFYTLDNKSPRIILNSPLNNAIINEMQDIILTIYDRDDYIGSGINLNTLNIYINNIPFVVNGVYNNNFISDYNQLYIDGINGYQIILTPSIIFNHNEIITIYVSVEDNAKNTTKEVFNFKISEFKLEIKNINPINNIQLNNLYQRFIFTLVSNNISLIDFNRISILLNNNYLVYNNRPINNYKYLQRKISNNAIDIIIDDIYLDNNTSYNLKIIVYDYYNNEYIKEVNFTTLSHDTLLIEAFPSGCIYDNNILIHLISNNNNIDIYYKLNDGEYIQYTNPIVISTKERINILKFYGIDQYGNRTRDYIEKYIYSNSIEEKIISNTGLINSDLYLDVKLENLKYNNNMLFRDDKNNRYKYFYDFGRNVYIESIYFDALSSRFILRLYDENKNIINNYKFLDYIDGNIFNNGFDFNIIDDSTIEFISNNFDSKFIYNYPIEVNNINLSFSALFKDLIKSIYNKLYIEFYDDYNNVLSIEKLYCLSNNINILSYKEGNITINDFYYDNIEKIVDGYQLSDITEYVNKYNTVDLNLMTEENYNNIEFDDNCYIEIIDYDENTYKNFQYNNGFYSNSQYGWIKYYYHNNKYYLPIKTKLIPINDAIIKAYNYNNNTKKYIYENNNNVYNILVNSELYINNEENNLIEISGEFDGLKEIIIRTNNNINDKIRCRIKINGILITQYDIENKLTFINTHDFYIKDINNIILKKSYNAKKIEIITILDIANISRKIDSIYLYGDLSYKNIINYEIYKDNNKIKIRKYNNININNTLIRKSIPIDIDINKIIDAEDKIFGYKYTIEEDEQYIRLINYIDDSKTLIFAEPIECYKENDRTIIKLKLDFNINSIKNAWIYYPSLNHYSRIIDYYIYDNYVDIIINDDIYIYDGIYLIIIPSFYNNRYIDYIYNKNNKKLYFINESRRSSGEIKIDYIKDINIIKNPVNGIDIYSNNNDIVKITINNINLKLSEIKDIFITLYKNDIYNDVDSVYLTYYLDNNIEVYTINSYPQKEINGNFILYKFINNLNNNDLIKFIEITCISRGRMYIGEIYLSLFENYINSNLIVKYNNTPLINSNNKIIDNKNDKYSIDYINGYLKVKYNNDYFNINTPINNAKMRLILENKYGEMNCVISNLLFKKYYDSKNNKINDIARYIEIEGEIYE